jgi:predicted nuclease of predicted toxin-antitoxin system
VKFKLDENLGLAEARILRDAGFDAATVPDQQLQGAPDGALISICRDEGRALVTLDAEFGNPLLYPPTTYRGIVLLRLTGGSVRESLLACMGTLRDALLSLDAASSTRPNVGSLDKSLWIVQPGRVRVYQPDHSLRARHPELTEEDFAHLRIVHAFSTDHRDAVLASSQCGCFYCLSCFFPSEVKQWSPDGRTALCPKCGIDSVLPTECGTPLTGELLKEMNLFWFGPIRPNRGAHNASN